MGVRIAVDVDGCIGSGECVAIDPDAVELDEAGIARMLIDDLDEDRAERICRSCPVSALSIVR